MVTEEASAGRAPRRWRGPAASIAVVVGALIAAVVALPHVPPVRTAVLTAALVPELLDLPVRPLSDSVPEPSRLSATYGQTGDRLDVYVPAGAHAESRTPAVVLALGVHPQPIDHPDIARVARALSRLGVFVGVADSSALRNLDVTPAEPAHLADAVLVLRAWPGVDPARVGLAGFSAGASIALIAAADERIAAELRFVSAFGGYADAELLLIDVASRSALVDGVERAWQPDPGIRADVVELLLATLPEAAERQKLRTLLTPFVASEGPPSGPRDEDLAQLAADARAIYLLFTSPDRRSATLAIAGLSTALRSQLAGISPVNFVDGLHAPVFLLHGEPDTAIPVGHAELLAERLGDRVARFTRFGEFGHGDPAQRGLGPDDMGDVFELYLYLRDIVAAGTE